ncbi:MAG: hypothetical protein MUC97_15885 [Bernardetiaceae bacterium]|jgi:hypothetical protein|nr:hypothetical protein [Bernardetiaceae bacterium]
MKCCFFLATALALACISCTVNAQNLTGDIDQGGQIFKYQLRPQAKAAGRYDLTVDLAQPGQPAERVYESYLATTGAASPGKTLAVTLYKASKENGRWLTDPKSLVEVAFDYAKNEVRYRQSGSIAQFAEAALTDVVDKEVAEITQPEALQYALTYLLVNYPRVLVISGESADQVGQLSSTAAPTERASLKITPDLIKVPLLRKFAHEGKNYILKLTLGERGRHDLEVRRYTGSETGSDVLIVYNSYLMLRDSVADQNKYVVNLHLALNKGYTWLPYPASFLTCSFEGNSATMFYRPQGKIKEYQSPAAPRLAKVPSTSDAITKEELVETAVKHFLTHYPKLLTNNE